MSEVDCGLKATGSRSNRNTSSRGILGYQSYHKTRTSLAISRLSSQFEPRWKSTKTKSTFPIPPGQTSQPSHLECFWHWNCRTRTISSSSGTFLIRDTRHLRTFDIPTVQNSITQKTHPFRYTSTSRTSLQFWYLYTPVSADHGLTHSIVYDISILSAIPSPLLSALPLEPLPTRLDPLFSIGIHDIDTLIQRQQSSFLSKDSREAADLSYGWVACTTDDVLIQKKTLYDILVMLPAHHSSRAVEKAWPTLRTAEGSELKATQRDLRRYRTLRQCLKRAAGPRSRGTSPYTAGRQSTDELADDDQYEDETDQTPLLAIENTHETYDDASSTTDEKLIEPSSWSELAYSSFMWWASAGEKRGDRDDEAAHDAALFRDFAEYSGSGSARPNSRRRSIVSAGGADTGEEGNGAKEMAVIAYFHRLTTLILGTLVEVIEGVGWREEDGDPREDGGTEREGLVVVGSEDMSRMGLDVWSEGDRNFVVDLVDFYWGRKAEIGGGRVECCGVRIY